MNLSFIICLFVSLLCFSAKRWVVKINFRFDFQLITFIIPKLENIIACCCLLGPCPAGSYPCDNFTKCVLQRQMCDSFAYCDDKYDEDALECGLFYGSTNFTTKLYVKENRTGSKNFECGKTIKI